MCNEQTSLLQACLFLVYKLMNSTSLLLLHGDLTWLHKLVYIAYLLQKKTLIVFYLASFLSLILLMKLLIHSLTQKSLCTAGSELIPFLNICGVGVRTIVAFGGWKRVREVHIMVEKARQAGSSHCSWSQEAELHFLYFFF